jgi:hypothetical protein
MYYFQGETIFALLPYKITKENNSEVIIRTYEAAEKTDKLYEIQYTNMAKHTAKNCSNDMNGATKAVIAPVHDKTSSQNSLLLCIWRVFNSF